jgi:hypothetical protein
MTSKRLLLTLPLLLLTLACSHQENAAPTDSASTNTPPEAIGSSKDPVPAEAAATSDAPIGTISSRGTMPDAPAAAPGGSIDFDLPASWQSQPPESQMRLAQAAIPGAGGPGQLAVFFFGPGGGGTVDANIQRWIDQMEVPAGSSPKPESFQTGGGFKVTWVEVVGTLKPSTMGAGPATEQPGSRLLGAVVEGPGGPWFFKATGPDSTLAAAREDFLKMLKGVRAK